jgi:hypothetical protein
LHSVSKTKYKTNAWIVTICLEQNLIIICWEKIFYGDIQP